MADNSKKTILIVDDEASIRESLKIILSRSYSIVLAENGEEALRLFNKDGENPESHGSPDLVILDVMMPGLDGLGLRFAVCGRFAGPPGRGLATCFPRPGG